MTAVRKEKSAGLFNQIGFSYLALLVVPVLLFFFSEWVLLVLERIPVDNTFALMLVQYILMLALGIPIVSLIARNHSLPLHVPSQPKMKGMALFKLFAYSFGASYLINQVCTALLSFFAGTDGNVVAEAVTVLSLQQTFILFVVVAPIAEEIIYRQLLYKVLGAFGNKVYMVVSALFFSLIHMNLTQSLYAFAIGLIFAWVMYRTGKILYPIILHAALNFLMAFVPVAVFSSSSEIALYLLAGLFIVLALMSIVMAVFDLMQLRQKKKTVYEEGELPVPSWKKVFINPGMLLHIVIGLVILTYITVTIALA